MKTKLPLRACVLIPLALALPGRSQEHVRIQGHVHVPVHLEAPVDLTVVTGDSSCTWVPVSDHGRFRVDAGPDQCYLLRFDQPGSLSKSVRVDTRHVERKVGEEKRVVSFDVVLHPEEETGDLRYASAVGRVGFHRSNGRQQVVRNYTLEQQALVVMDDMPACDGAAHP